MATSSSKNLAGNGRNTSARSRRPDGAGTGQGASPAARDRLFLAAFRVIGPGAPDHFSVPEHEPELESKFVRAARPVLRRIAADLAALDVSLVLTDDSANVLMRSDGSRSIRARLDRVSLGPGYTYSEDSVGTPRPLGLRGHPMVMAEVLSRLGAITVNQPISSRP